MGWTNTLELSTTEDTTTQTLIPHLETDLLTLEQVKAITQLEQAAIYANAAKGKFPAPIKVGGANRWLRTEIVNYLMQKVLERNARLAAKKGTAGVESTSR